MFHRNALIIIYIMDYIDFHLKMANLHKEMYHAIIELMNEYKVTHVSLLETNASHAFTILAINGADDVTEVEVNEVILRGNSVFITTLNEGYEDGEFDLAFCEDVVTCSIADIYESLYEHLVYGK